MTTISCPACRTILFKIEPVSQHWRTCVRCNNPDCTRVYTVAARPSGLDASKTTISVSFSQHDRVKNGDPVSSNGKPKLNVAKLASMHLDELRAYVSTEEDFVTALTSSYDEEFNRLNAFYLQRRKSAEVARDRYIKGPDPHTVAACIDRSAKKQDKTGNGGKPKLNDAYRANVMLIFQMQVTAGIISPRDAANLLNNVGTDKGLFAIADRLGIPRLT